MATNRRERNILDCLFVLSSEPADTLLERVESLLDELDRRKYRPSDFDSPDYEYFEEPIPPPEHQGVVPRNVREAESAEPPTTTKLSTFSDYLSEFRRVRQILSEAREACWRPEGKLLAGEALSESEYYMFRAALSGWVPPENFPPLTKALGRDEYDDYALYCHLYYEDDKHAGYIYPDCFKSATKDESSSLILVRPIRHEDVSKASLRPDQREFWKKEFPEDFARFGD